MMEHKSKSEEIIKALEHSQKAIPSEEFLSRMEHFAELYTTVRDNISIKSILGIAASFALLIALNIGMIGNANKVDKTETNAQVESAYNLIPTKSLYHE